MSDEEEPTRGLVRLTEVAEQRDGYAIIEDEQYIGLDLWGPAVIVLENSSLLDVTFNGSAQGIVLEVADFEGIVGVIVLRNVTIMGCETHNIGLLATPELAVFYRQQLGIE